MESLIVHNENMMLVETLSPTLKKTILAKLSEKNAEELQEFVKYSLLPCRPLLPPIINN